MIKQVSHTVAGIDPAGFTLALEVAYELHAPTTRDVQRAPEVAVTSSITRRGSAATTRTRRRTAVRG